jgi:hypothetical protein
LAWFLVNCPVESQRDPARAIRLIDKAAGQWFLNWETFNAKLLAAAYYRLGDHRAALANQDDGIRLERGIAHSEDLFFRAMACWRLGDKERARRDYDEGVRLMLWQDDKWSEIEQYRAEAAALLGVK